jgi:hypothetical protein
MKIFGRTREEQITAEITDAILLPSEKKQKQIEAVEAQAKEATGESKKAEAEVKTAKAKAEAETGKAKAKETAAQEAEAQVTVAEAEAKQAETEARAAEVNRKKVEAQPKADKPERIKTEIEAREAEAKAQAKEEAAKARVTAAKAKVAEARAEANKAKAQERAANARLKRAEADAKTAEAKLRTKKAEAEAFTLEHFKEIDKLKAYIENRLPNGISLEDVFDGTAPIDILVRVRREIAAYNADFFDKAYELWLNSITSAIPTQGANAIGGAVSNAHEFSLQRIAEAMVNIFVRDKDSATFGELPRLWKTLLTAQGTAARNAWTAFKNEDRAVLEESLGRAGMASKIESHRGPAIKGRLGKVIRTPLNLLTMVDTYMRTLSAYAESAVLAARRAKKEGLKGQDFENRIQELLNDTASKNSVWNEALSKADELAFVSELGAPGKLGLEARRKIPGLRYQFPFIVTPANIFKTGLRKSPFGAIPLALKLGRQGLVNLEIDRTGWKYSKKAFVRDAAEQVLAGAAFYTLYPMIFGDGTDDLPVITGTQPFTETTKGQREHAQRTIPPMSIRLGDKTFSYARIEPFATMLGTTIDLMNTLKNAEKDHDVAKAMSDVVSHLQNQVLDKTYMKSIADLVEVVTGKEDPSRLVSNFATSWVPNIARSAARAADPYVRETKVWGDGSVFWERYGSRARFNAFPHPINSPPPKPKVDLWGREIKKQAFSNAGADVAWKIFVPIDVRRVQDQDPAFRFDRMISNWNNQNPDAGLYPQTPTQSITERGEKIVMDDAEYNQFLRRAGELTVQRMVRQRWNIDEPKERDMDRMAKAIASARATAKRELLRSRRAKSE